MVCDAAVVHPPAALAERQFVDQDAHEVMTDIVRSARLFQRPVVVGDIARTTFPVDIGVKGARSDTIPAATTRPELSGANLLDPD
jgi:hypothetical protein